MFMPFRFARLPEPAGTVLLTNDGGDYAFVTEAELRDLVAHRLDPTGETYQDLHARHFIVSDGRDGHLDLIAAQIRTRKSFLRDGPTLHIFVVTLRCDHSCLYCQVSRQSADAVRFDMSAATMAGAVDRLSSRAEPTNVTFASSRLRIISAKLGRYQSAFRYS